MIIAYGLETEETIETTEKVLTQSTEAGQKSINLRWTFLYPLPLWELVNYHFAKDDKLMQSKIYLLTDRGKKLNLPEPWKVDKKNYLVCVPFSIFQTCNSTKHDINQPASKFVKAHAMWPERTTI